jgi:DNA-binding MurR/RpiR family transcriptional regulator
MEVRIGVKGALRELSIDSTQSAEEIEKAIEAALKDGAPTLTLSDEKGRRLVIAAEKLIYVEIAESEGRRVGFGAV